jgi:hypothetical protein
MSPLSALADVITERRRQIENESWSPAHDDEHRHGELSAAAVCYAMHAANALDPDTAIGLTNPPAWWPWELEWWKPNGTRRNLVKAAALILAEIERLDRCSTVQRASKHE